jgi:hypothetical protein
MMPGVFCFGRPSFLRHDPDEAEQILFYLDLGIKFHVREYKLKQLTVFPPGLVASDPMRQTSKGVIPPETITWKGTATWFIDEIPLDVSTAKICLERLLAHRRQLPPLYLLPESGVFSLSPCRHPEFKKCSMVVFKETELTGQIILEIIF